VVGHHVRREQLHRQLGRGEQPLVRGQDLHGGGVVGQDQTVDLKAAVHGAGPLLLQLQHGRGIEPQGQVLQDRRRPAAQIQARGVRPGQLIAVIGDAEDQAGALDVVVDAGDSQSGDHRDPVVRHRVAEDGTDLDVDRHPVLDVHRHPDLSPDVAERPTLPRQG
jgi:hypothetical protein